MSTLIVESDLLCIPWRANKITETRSLLLLITSLRAALINLLARLRSTAPPTFFEATNALNWAFSLFSKKQTTLDVTILLEEYILLKSFFRVMEGKDLDN